MPPDGKRLSRDELFMEMAKLASLRSTCLRGHVGAVITLDGRPVSIGYNGSPPGLAHCLDVGCEPLAVSLGGPIASEERRLELFGCQRTVHAEANAIAWAARNGLMVWGTRMYATHSPCVKCAQLMVSAGISELVYAHSYRAEALDVLASGGVEVERWCGWSQP